MFSSFLCAADIISTVEFNHTGELLATGDKGGRVVIFQQEIEVGLKVFSTSARFSLGFLFICYISESRPSIKLTFQYMTYN